jgi:hypothetical protein
LKSYNSDDVVAFTKTLGNKKVLVLSNLRNKPVVYSIPSELVNSSWKDAFNGSSTKLNGEITLAPYTYLVYQN